MTAGVQLREGTVRSVEGSWSGAVELVVSVGAEQVPALAYPALLGAVAAGQRVLLNIGAYRQGLGTGGLALVVARLDSPAAPAAAPSPGHLVKARYTPLQVSVLGVDEDGSPHRDAMLAAEDLGGTPVVVCDLHSSLPAVVAGVHADRPGARVAYVLTDGGALPAWFSRTVAGLRAAGALVGCVSAGQAFGGDLEAVSVHSALLACRAVLTADVVVVAQGPGNLGSGTEWGFSGVAVGEALNAAGVLGGRPVAALRVSAADQRPRHRGVSHHSHTAVGRLALVACDVAVPELSDGFGELGEQVREEAAGLGGGRHRVVTVECDGLEAALRASPVELSTMGRGLEEDLPAFLAAAAAGRHAARLLG